MSAQTPQIQLSRRDLRALATVARCDERTCAKVLAGLRTRPEVTERVRAALVSLGLAPVAALTPQAISSTPTARA